jgi:hypothetical protein
VEQFDEVAVLGDNDYARLSCRGVDVRIFGITQPDVPNGERIQVESHPQPDGEDGRDATGSRDDDRMGEATGCEAQTGIHILGFQVREFLENLLTSETRGEQVQDIRHANAHAPDTGASAALARVYGDSIDVAHDIWLRLRAILS